MCLIVVPSTSRLLESPIEESTPCQLGTILHRILSGRQSPPCMRSPSSVLRLLFNKSIKVYALIKLIRFRPWVTDPSLVVQIFSNLTGQQLPCKQMQLLTFITCWLSIRRNLLPSFCSSTVVNGSGFHLLVGLFCNPVTLARRAARHLSKSIMTDARSKRR